MNFQTLFIDQIRIEQFKKIRDFEFEPNQGANLFFGSYRSGKTSLCEFIQFILYGADSVSLARGNAEDAKGSITFSADGEKYAISRSVIDGAEDFSFVRAETQEKVDTTLTPGEYLTGLDRKSFDFIAYFKQSRYEAPVFRPMFSFLDTLASFSPQTKNLYRTLDALEQKLHHYRNDQKNGSLDLLLETKLTLENQLSSRPGLEEEANSCTANLAEVSAKLDENDRRCVLIKADMASHTDDLKLSRNKENAQDLLRQIQANEKKLRIVQYDVANKIGKLEPEELDEMKEDYNRLSLAITNLNEARVSLSSAQENLAFHEKLFTGTDTVEHYEAEKKRIVKSKYSRMILRILAVILLASGASLGIILKHFGFNLPLSITAGASFAVFAIALASFSSVFTATIQRILSTNEKESLSAFEEYLDRLRAHAKTTQVYRDQVDVAEDFCLEKSTEMDEAQEKISTKIQRLGYSGEDEELLAICDEIIDANDSLYDLQDLIREEKEEYRRILSTDVENKTLSVSPEFSALQKELAFLTAQNDSLYKKKAALSSRLAVIRDALAKDPKQAKKALKEVCAKIDAQTVEFEALSIRHALSLSKKEHFERDLKAMLAQKINAKLSFMLKEGESYLFDESFEICFCDQKSVLPLISIGGGMVSEMGQLAFRLSLAEMLKKNGFPMIFDDSLSSTEKESARFLYELLKKTCTQFFIATSSQDILQLCSDSAKVASLS